MNDLETETFDYSVLDEETVGFLKDRENSIYKTLENTTYKIGEDLYKAQQKLSNHYNGIFEEWYTALGFKKQNVYNFINRYKYVVQSLDNQNDVETFQELPTSLQNEMSKPSANKEINQKVFDGDITTHKQYQSLEYDKKQIERAKQQVEKRANQLEEENDYLKEEIEEISNQEPEVKEVVKKEIPEEIQKEIDHLKKMNELNQKAVDEKQKQIDAYELKDTTYFDEESEEWELKKLQSEADRSTTEIRVAFKQLNDKVSVSKFLYDAISACNDYEKKKMRDELDITKEIISSIETSLKNRREIN